MNKWICLLLAIVVLTGCTVYTTSPQPAPTTTFKYRITIDDVEYVCTSYRLRDNRTAIIMRNVLGYPDVNYVIVEDFVEYSVETITGDVEDE